MTRRATAVVGAVLAVALGAAPAFADPFSQYQQTGRIDPCAYSPGQLQSALGSIPNDIAQYAPDYGSALQAALGGRAGCGAGGQTAAVPGAAPGSAPPGAPLSSTGAPVVVSKTVVHKPPAPPPVPGARSHTRGHSDRALALPASSHTATPAPVILLGIFAGILLLVGLIAALARYLGWGLEWLAPVRHAGAEVGLRLREGWSAALRRLSPGTRPQV